MYTDERLKLNFSRVWTWVWIAISGMMLTVALPCPANAGCGCGKTRPHLFCADRHGMGHVPSSGDTSDLDTGGTWYWMRSPEQERRVTMNLYNRYCIRCHGIDGRGVWDIPDVPDFSNKVWQATRPDSYRTRVVLEGRGAVMPSFRGTITLEEAAALGRYLNTFVPGTEVSRPALVPAAPNSVPAAIPASTATTAPAATTSAPSAPPVGTSSPFTR